MAPAQESGLRENCTSRLSERAEAGRTLDLSRLYSDEAGEQSEESPLRRRLRGRSQRCRWSEGRGPRGIRTSKARTGLRARVACQRRWSVYGDLCRYPPEAGAVCGKAARTDLGGGRAMKRTSLPLHRRTFITLLGGAAAAWPLGARAQETGKVARIGFLGPSIFNDPSSMFIPLYQALLAQLRVLGFNEGQNLVVTYGAVDDARGLPAVAAELTRSQPELIVVSGTEAMLQSVLAANRAVPIVLIAVNFDPIARGYVTRTYLKIARRGRSAINVG